RRIRVRIPVRLETRCAGRRRQLPRLVGGALSFDLLGDLGGGSRPLRPATGGPGRKVRAGPKFGMRGNAGVALPSPPRHECALTRTAVLRYASNRATSSSGCARADSLVRTALRATEIGGAFVALSARMVLSILSILAGITIAVALAYTGRPWWGWIAGWI